MNRAPTSLQSVAQRLRDAQILLDTRGPLDVLVTGVSQDSREVAPGDLFLAWKGVDHDAHEYLTRAVAAGAVAAVVERMAPGLDATQLQVRNGRLAGALAADSVMGSPWQALFLGGVTGTNGKTTTTVLARHLLQTRDDTVAIGTLGLVETTGGIRPGTEGLTTPGPVRISEWTRELADAGVKALILEASSHALAQYRLDGLRFDVVVFTNLGRDHLDYHVNLAEYRDAKTRLLKLLKAPGWAVVFKDEEAWAAVEFPRGQTLTVGIDSDADFRALDVELHDAGARFRLVGGEEEALVDLPLLGRFNVENALTAAGLAWVGGMSIPEIARGLSGAPQVPGRLEVVASEPCTVLLDFAHTPDALETVLDTLRPLVSGRLLVLFGAGGDRDRGKRPRMGEVVARRADLAFVTSDNPRTEDPDRIIDDVVVGMKGAAFRRVTDRREAIAEALREARPGDLLLLAGKGHESYQVVGREKLPFDEGGIVREILTRGKGAPA
ncbi:MAG: UDP-N-acetylmuramoyl-L-alanyl-D-glutamate--2,6-diaminopimelate ligase [Longimicrobiales bacterium]